MSKNITKREEKIIKIFNELSLKYQDILIRRFIKGQTQKEVGTTYNMTAERVRQLEEQALELIRDVMK